MPNQDNQITIVPFAAESVNMRILHLISLGIFAALVSPSGGFAHTIEEKIADCGCDAPCFTDEVSALSCTQSQLTFQSHGLPDASHPLMVGIVGNNQQFPSTHNLEFSLPIHPELASSPTQTVAGAIGVAINGVPIFDPSTQGPPLAETGKPVTAAAAGELDACGGHAGRGDDYHYHRAPNCLIEDMGVQQIEVEHRPIGYAADGFPILALGWFDASHNIEQQLDPCRGATDGAGRYFYNVENQGNFAVLDCYSGTEQRFAKDHWDQRKDASGDDIVGIPIKLAVSAFNQVQVGADQCSVMQGTLGAEKLLRPDGTVVENSALNGTLFHCSSQCYGQFVEAPFSLFTRGRILVFEAVVDGCAANFGPAHFAGSKGNAFLGYTPLE
jgi:hypothetical protein